MPQMSPLLWLNLMIMFLTGFLIFFIMSYYVKVPSRNDVSVSKKTSIQKDWKW